MAINVGGAYTELTLRDNMTPRVRQATSAVRNFQSTVGVAHGTVINLNTALAMLTGVGLASLVVKTIQAGNEFQALERRISVMANSLTAHTAEVTSMAKEYGWLYDTAIKTGSSIDDLGKAYARLVPAAAAAGIPMERVREAIVGTIGAGVVMGASQDEMRRAFIAIGQVVGKDALQMEELRQQLGEALPNSMLIAAEGMTLLKRELGELGEDEVYSIASLVKDISQSKIDAETFINIWTRGTATYAKFAEAASMTVAGQVQATRTIVTQGLGRFMSDSGIQNSITAGLTIMNSGLQEMFADITAAAPAALEQVEEAFFETALTVARFWDDTFEVNRFYARNVVREIELIVGGLVSGVQAIGSIPVVGPALLEFGLLGLIFGGAKLRTVLLLGTTIAGWSKELFGIVDGAAKLEGLSGVSADAFSDDSLTVTDALREQGHEIDIAVEKWLEHLGEAIGRDRLERILQSEGSGRAELLKDEIAKVEAQLVTALANGGTATLERARDLLAGRGISTQGMDDAGVRNAFLSIIPEDAKNEEEARIRDYLEGMGASVAELQSILTGLNHLRGLAPDWSTSELMQELFDFDYEEWKNREIGSFESAVSDFRERFAEETRRIEEAISELLGEQFSIQQSNDHPILGKLSEAELRASMNRWLKLVAPMHEVDTPAGAIAAKFKKDMIDLEAEVERWDAMELPTAMAQEGLYKQTLASLSKMSGSATLELTRKDLEDRLMLFDQYVDEMVAIYNSLMLENPELAEQFAAFQEYAAEYRKGLEATGAKLISRQGRGMARDGERPFAERVSQLEAVTEAENKALDAIIEKQRNAELFAAKAALEEYRIGAGLMDQRAAIYSISDAERERLVLSGAVNGLIEEIARGQWEIQIAANETVMARQNELDILQMQAEVQELLRQNALTGTEAYRTDYLALEHANIEAEMAKLELESWVNGQPGTQERLLNLEIAKLNQERSVLEQRAAIDGDPGRREALLNLEIEKLAAEARALEDQMMLLSNPAYVGQMHDNAGMQGQVELMRLMAEWQMDFANFWKVELPGLVQGFHGQMTNMITSVVMGTNSIREAMANMVTNIVQSIVQIFAQWAVQQAMMWAMNMLGIGMTTKATTAAAAAATAAWTPAAVAASIATLGGALTAGTAAMVMIAGSGAAIGGLQNVIAQAPGTMAANPGIFHDGGIFGPDKNFNQLMGQFMSRPIKSDEGLALLQQGELIVPRDQVAEVFAAMQLARNYPLGVYHDGGMFGTGLSNVRQEDVDEMAAGRPEIVNYFDWNEVDRHMIRNPNAVLNIIATDKRNRGRTSHYGG